jgi:hypothetical protein
LVAYEALTEEEQAAEEQPEPPVEPVLFDSFIQPVAPISEFWDFQMKPGKSMANMVSRL